MEIQIKEQKQVNKAMVVYQVLTNVLNAEDPLDRDKEHMWVFGLNAKNYILYVDLVHLGSANECHCHAREIFRRACIKSAISILIAHNHPSGVPYPSNEDRLMTYKIKNAGDILGIRLLDHVIIGRECFYSFTEDGTLNRTMKGEINE